jgi:hypothetical protein
MSKSHESPKRNKLKRGLAVGAVSLAAAMSPGAANAATAHNKKPAKFQMQAQLEKQTEARMLHGKSVAFLRGNLVIVETVKDPIDPNISHGVELNIKNPFLVYRRDANSQTGFKDIEGSGEYAIGYMDQTGDKPKVKLVNYDGNSMFFNAEPGNTGPNIQYAFFQRDGNGGINLHSPVDSFDGRPHGGPLTDPAGNPEQVGLAYVPMK